ncbi:uncharacterized protein [Coffea arabica]|uniref:Integrase catalytic domain-containing protein n=1 Tax=Coffea arabica TaxID=13443 RepID=A0ABM4VCF5_COFAR
MDMAPPRNIKEIQRLTGRMVALNRFLSRSAVRALPFFRILKAPKDFQWIEECQKTFTDLKAYLAELPTLTAPEQGETLFLYLSAYNKAVSAILVREDKGAQRPIYYVSRADSSVAESSSPSEEVRPEELWVLFVDGVSSKEGSGAGLLLTSPTGEELTYALRFDFPASNNEAEYETLLTGLRVAHQMGAEITEQARGRSVKTGVLLVCSPEQGSLGGVFRDAAALVQQCRVCQVHAPLRHQPTQEMVPIHSPWPFVQWGIDLVGPFPRVSRRYEHLVVAIDYFTKWMEAKPLAAISGKAVQKFFWKNIVCRFGIPHVLISDNVRQFAENPFKSWCAEFGISQHFTSVGHPQANGQVENVNRTILQGLKTRLELAQSNWLDELPSVFWAYRTTPRTATHGPLSP